MIQSFMLLNVLCRQDFEVIETKHSPLTSELTANQAHLKLKSALKSGNVPWPDGIVQLSFFRSKANQSASWEFTFSLNVTATIDAESGSLLNLEDARQNDVTSDRPFDGEFTDQGKAEARIADIAKLFGAPTNQCDVSFGRPNKAGKNGYWPGVAGTFQLNHKGRKVLGCSGTYAIVVRNGNVLAISQNFSCSIIKEKPSISVEECVAKATAAYNRALDGKEPLAYDSLKDLAKYVYAIIPNRGATERTIACQIRFGKDGVMVDASRGDIFAVSIYPRIPK